MIPQKFPFFNAFTLDFKRLLSFAEKYTILKGVYKSMKHKIQCILASLLAIWLLACPALALSFPDVDDYLDYSVAVDYISDLGIMVGDEKGNFNPNKTVTRAEMAAIVCRMLGETADLTTADTFVDVPISHWANVYVATAASFGIIGGYGNGRFGPSDAVTYEQAVTMFVRFLGYEYEANDVGGYPNGYMMIAQDLGLLEGVNAKNGATLNRSNVAIIIYNCYHSYV